MISGAVKSAINGMLRTAYSAKYVHEINTSPAATDRRGRRKASVKKIKASHTRKPRDSGE